MSWGYYCRYCWCFPTSFEGPARIPRYNLFTEPTRTRALITPDTNAQVFDLTSTTLSTLCTNLFSTVPSAPKVESIMSERRQATWGQTKSDERFRENRKLKRMGGNMHRAGKGNYPDPHQSFANLDKKWIYIGKRLSVLYTTSIFFDSVHPPPRGPNCSTLPPPHACRQRAQYQTIHDSQGNPGFAEQNPSREI